MADATLGLLSLVQWLSPAFPTGGYAYSHGLEWAVSQGDVHDAQTVEGWLADVLEHGAAWGDAVILACVLRGADPEALSDTVYAMAGSKERLRETCEQGAAFALAAHAIGVAQGRAYPLPIAVGLAAVGLDLPPEHVIATYLHSFASNLTSAAVRFVPLGQNAGQGVLRGLHPLIHRLAVRATQSTPDDITTAAFGAEIAAMAHETQTVRIFKT
ncbi:urease accessory protein UreF [Albirhodobacter sp. R86504]|uniref:urease accessory protein UreF n=1 Tax=Albirhodobacter sp. R86504 TaxID=3093848 RepID=UPI003673394D